MSPKWCQPNQEGHLHPVRYQSVRDDPHLGDLMFQHLTRLGPFQCVSTDPVNRLSAHHCEQERERSQPEVQFGRYPASGPVWPKHRVIQQ